MAPRAVGALFALVAALAFALALAGGLVPKTVPGWWDGHPVVKGKPLERKVIHVGLIEADGCNLGETTRCEELPTGHTLDVVGFAEIGALGLGIVTAILAAVSIKRTGDRRKFLGKLLLFEVLLIGGGAGAIFVHGPDLRVDFQLGMPVGLGLFAIAGGCAFAFLAGVLAQKVEPEPLRLKTSEQRIPNHQQQPAFDVREFMHAPQAPQTPMRVSHPHMVPPSPGGPLAGPSGPLTPMGQMGAPAGAMGNPNPLFETAPQLRPLYDMQNAGAAPNPMAPVLPQRPPTPIPRDQIDARFGRQPPPLEVPTPATHGPMPDYPAAGDSASFHPPVNVYPPVVAAPPPAPVAARSIEQTEDLERPSDPGFSDPFSKQEPIAPAARVAMAPPPRTQRPSMPPPPRKSPTIATAVPPMPQNVEVDHAPRARPSELDIAMTVPLEKHSSSSFDVDSSRFVEPLPPRQHGVDEAGSASRGSAAEWQRGVIDEAGSAIGDATSQTSSAPDPTSQSYRVGDHTGENFDEALTREPERFSPLAPPPPPMFDAESPSQIAHAETELAQFDASTAANGVAFDQESSPVIAPPAPPPSPPPTPRAKPTAPPPLPTGNASQNLRAQSEAPTTSADVDRAAKSRSQVRPGSEVPTVAARGTGQKDSIATEAPANVRATSGTRTTSSVANEAATAAAPASANEALAAASVTTPTSEGPRPSWGSPEDASEAKKPGPPKPWGVRDHSLEIPTVPSSGPTPSSSPGEGPARIGVPNIPSRTPLPAPRVGRPSVPPPAAKLPAFAKPSTLVASNGKPDAPANKSTTSPTPFGTIPSPFGKIPTIPPPVAPLPPLPKISETLTTPQPIGDVPTIHEEPTQAPRKHPRASSDVIEPPTYAVRSNGAAPIVSELAPDVAGEIERRSDRSLDPSSTDKSGVSVDEPVSRPSSETVELPTYGSGMPQAKYNIRNSEAPTRAVGSNNKSNLEIAATQAVAASPRAVTSGRSPSVPISTAPTTLPPPKQEQQQVSGPSPACPQCESPMAWVEEHLRFYCASCRMYF